MAYIFTSIFDYQATRIHALPDSELQTFKLTLGRIDDQCVLVEEAL